jgi:gamma-glutamylcyclotransferase (GGCT)/AIG2-like uncharacterized protein YtfP
MRFFFYGTLIAGSGNPVAERIHAKLRERGPAVARGRLLAIPTAQGWYPAFISERQGAGVHGMTYETLPGFSAQDLALLDDYEAYDADHPDMSEYWRQRIDIVCDGCTKAAEAYVYRAALPPGALAVSPGDFRAFLDAHGLHPYRISAEEVGRALARLRRG